MLHKSGIIILILLIRDHTNTTLRMMLQNRKRKSEHIFNQQKSRKNLTFAQKCEICEKYCKKPKPSQTDLATEYCVRQSTISDILSNKDIWLHLKCARKNPSSLLPQVGGSFSYVGYSSIARQLNHQWRYHKAKSMYLQGYSWNSKLQSVRWMAK